MARTVQKDDTIRVHYTGRLEDDTLFDSSEGKDPIEFTVGKGQLIPGFESGVVGMAPGEKKTISIPPAQAYGERQQELLGTVGRDQFPPEITPEAGMQLQVKRPDGGVIPVVVVEVNGERGHAGRKSAACR
jgi:peptidylprolyl isomerase